MLSAHTGRERRRGWGRSSRGRLWLAGTVMLTVLGCGPSDCPPQGAGRHQGTAGSSPLERYVACTASRDTSGYWAAVDELVAAQRGHDEVLEHLSAQLRVEVRSRVRWPVTGPPTAEVLLRMGAAGVRPLLQGYRDVLEDFVIYSRAYWMQWDTVPWRRAGKSIERDLAALVGNETEEEYIRWGAVAALRALGVDYEPETVLVLLRVAANGASSQWAGEWGATAFSLSEGCRGVLMLGGARSQAGLMAALRSIIPEIQVEAMVVAGNLVADRAPFIPVLREALTEPDAGIRAVAAKALCDIGGDSEALRAFVEDAARSQAQCDELRVVRVLFQWKWDREWAVGALKELAGRTRHDRVRAAARSARLSLELGRGFAEDEDLKAPDDADTVEPPR